MKDQFGRNIHYLRLSVTDRCNLRCRYCMPKEGIQKERHDEILSFEEILQLVSLFVKAGIDKIRLTGGEPLVRKKLPNLIEAINRENSIRDFSITTNGILLKHHAREILDAGISRINISLDTMKAYKFREIAQIGDLKDVLEGIATVQALGFKPIKINTVLIKGVNDDEIEDFINLTRHEDLEVRFIELMPVGGNRGYSRTHFMPNTEVLKRCPDLIPISGTDKSSTASKYVIPGYRGRVGLISPNSHKFCGACNRVRLTADGKMKTCLLSNEEVDLKSALRRNVSVEELIRKNIFLKPGDHHLETGGFVTRNMSAIGG